MSERVVHNMVLRALQLEEGSEVDMASNLESLEEENTINFSPASVMDSRVEDNLKFFGEGEAA